MLVSCWSAKGGVGTTVVASALARLCASAHAGRALLVDVAGDVPAAMGLPEPDGPGLVDWLAAGPAVPPDALGRLELTGGDGLSYLPFGSPSRIAAAEERPEWSARAEVLATLLANDGRPVVIDCGTVTSADSVGGVLASVATRSVLVTRACFLALRRAQAVPIRPSEVVVVAEPGRALDDRDITELVGAPVRARVPFDPAVSRAVDAGLFRARLPRSLVRSLSDAA